MTTELWATRIRHDSDAAFREWGSELNTKMALVGLIQTADTGQINWVTVTRPSANTDAGYEIWRFDDSLQGTAPIYFKLYFGAGGNISIPRMRVQVGSGSNGSGTITGTFTAVGAQTIGGGTTATTDTLRTSYMCCLDGAFWMAWKNGGSGAQNMFMHIARTCDGNGDPTVTGAILISGGSNAACNTQCLRFASPATVFTAVTAPNGTLGFLPQSQASSINALGQMQVAVGWMWAPDVLPIFSIVGAIPADAVEATTFEITPVGTTPRTFIALGIDNLQFSFSPNFLKPCCIWE